jgi:hypothetical protein
MKASGHLLPLAFNQRMEPSLFGRSILGGPANNPLLLATKAHNAECARSFSQPEDHFRVDCRQTGINPSAKLVGARLSWRNIAISLTGNDTRSKSEEICFLQTRLFPS